jgi:hypothetical protein
LLLKNGTTATNDFGFSGIIVQIQIFDYAPAKLLRDQESAEIGTKSAR